MRDSLLGRSLFLVLCLLLPACGDQFIPDGSSGGDGSNDPGAIPPQPSAPPLCGVPFGELGAPELIESLSGRRDLSPSAPVTFPINVPSASTIARTLAQIAAKGIIGSTVNSFAGGAAGEFIKLLWPSNGDNEIAALIDAKIEEAVADVERRAVLKDARDWLENLRRVSQTYRDIVTNDAFSPEEQLLAWFIYRGQVDFVQHPFNVEGYESELIALYAEAASMEIVLYRDGVEAMGTKWPASQGLIDDTRERLDLKISQHRNYVQLIYDRTLLEAGDAEAAAIASEFEEGDPLAKDGQRQDHAQRLWTALNRVRREFSRNVFDLSDVWQSMRPDATVMPRITRPIYSDPVGCLPTSLPREYGEEIVQPVGNRGFDHVTAPFGVDGSLMRDVEGAILRLGRDLRTLVKIPSATFRYPNGEYSNVLPGNIVPFLMVEAWSELPALQWRATAVTSVAPGPDELLSEIEIRAKANLVFRMYGAPGDRGLLLPAHDLLREDLGLSRYDPADEVAYDHILVDVCNPIVRVRTTSYFIIESEPSSATADNFGGRYRSANRYNIIFEFLDGTSASVPSSPAAVAALDPIYDVGSNGRREEWAETQDTAYPGYVLSNVITVDGPETGGANQALIFAFRRADGYPEQE